MRFLYYLFVVAILLAFFVDEEVLGQRLRGRARGRGRGQGGFGLSGRGGRGRGGTCPRLDPFIRCVRQGDVLCRNDFECSGGRCCPAICGGTQCSRRGRPNTNRSCPRPLPPGPNCRNQQCFSDRQCGFGQVCCLTACGGTQCRRTTGPSLPTCRRPTNPSQCFAQQCFSDRQCNFGSTCCRTQCGGSICQRRNTGGNPRCRRQVNPGLCFARQCFSDRNCGFGQTCCSTVCGGRVCQRRGRGQNPGTNPNRSCPQVTIGGLAQGLSLRCPRECQNDNQCGQAFQCCDNECGGTKCVPIFVRG